MQLLLLGACLAQEARADIAYRGPLTYWSSPRQAPSALTLIVAGTAISGAIVAAGLLIAGRAKPTPFRRGLIAVATAVSVLLVLLLAVEIHREAELSRKRRSNLPVLPPPRAAASHGPADGL